MAMTGRFEGDPTKGDDWVLRYETIMGKAERRPASRPPERNGIYFVDFGSWLSPGPSSAAFYKDGVWLRSNRQPFTATVTHWTKIEDA